MYNMKNIIECAQEKLRVDDSITHNLGLVLRQSSRIHTSLSCLYAVCDSISYRTAIEHIENTNKEVSELNLIIYNLIQDIHELDWLITQLTYGGDEQV